jgi:hypothetical protein
MRYRKVGGLHWVACGSYRFAWCRVRKRKASSFEAHTWVVVAIGLAVYVGAMMEVFG